jgi:hypothetical protein
MKSRQYNTGRFPAPAICTRATKRTIKTSSRKRTSGSQEAVSKTKMPSGTLQSSIVPPHPSVRGTSEAKLALRGDHASEA